MGYCEHNESGDLKVCIIISMGITYGLGVAPGGVGLGVGGGVG